MYQAALVIGVLTGGRGRSFLRVDAQVIWCPPRSRAEYVSAGRFKAVRLQATTGGRRPRTIRRVVTSRAVITKLARSLNSLPANPAQWISCPIGMVSYRLTFVPAVAGQPLVVAEPGPCPDVSVTVGGRSQPDLLGGRAVIALVGRLLRRSVT